VRCIAALASRHEKELKRFHQCIINYFNKRKEEKT
jgi:hypothetical protein